MDDIDRHLPSLQSQPVSESEHPQTAAEERTHMVWVYRCVTSQTPHKNSYWQRQNWTILVSTSPTLLDSLPHI